MLRSSANSLRIHSAALPRPSCQSCEPVVAPSQGSPTRLGQDGSTNGTRIHNRCDPDDQGPCFVETGAHRRPFLWCQYTSEPFQSQHLQSLRGQLVLAHSLLYQTVSPTKSLLMTMHNQFIEAIHQLCQRRSAECSEIHWWFSQKNMKAHRVGADEFTDEATRPVQIP